MNTNVPPNFEEVHKFNPCWEFMTFEVPNFGILSCVHNIIPMA